MLRALMKRHTHHIITAEVRRELFSCPARGEKPVPTRRVVSATGAGVGGGAGAGAGAGAGMAAPTRARVFVWNKAADTGFKNAPVQWDDSEGVAGPGAAAAATDAEMS